ncbi:hypothetical protein [Dankookia sp. P2]|uniref:hypothetical protein n=1 Tax=Dankookia sp. P2 TaxID=3423955 RepID=UPI003D666246
MAAEQQGPDGTDAAMVTALRTATVEEVMVVIRNGTAHGDSRNVKPLHQRTDRGRVALVGFSVRSKPYTVILTAPMMVTFGTWLADQFLLAVEPDDERSAERDGLTMDLVNRTVRHIREARQ